MDDILHLTDAELMGLIFLLNEKNDRDVDSGMNAGELNHPKTGPTPLAPVLKQLLDRAVKRGIVRVPPCYRGPKLG